MIGGHSFVKLAERHKIGICTMKNLNWTENFNWNIFYIGKLQLIEKLTFLNNFRPHVMFPKHSNSTGRCTIAMIIGNNRLVSIENEYHSNWLIVSSIPPNASFILWLISQVMNTIANAKIPVEIVKNASITLSLCT